jgi:hypothetical protein
MVKALKSSMANSATSNFSSCKVHNTYSVAQYRGYGIGFEVMERHFVFASIRDRFMEKRALNFKCFVSVYKETLAMKLCSI